VYGRLINVQDGHFGISPDELRHGTFGRFRLVVHMDGLDAALRSNRETISEGPLLATAQDVLRSLFNAARATIEGYEAEEAPGAQLLRKIAASPGSLSRQPILALARAVLDGKAVSRFLVLPTLAAQRDRDAFLAQLAHRAATPEQFLTGLTIDYDGSTDDGIARYDTSTGFLKLNAWHPFVATFHDDFAIKGSGRPLELIAMAEVLIEAHLFAAGIRPEQISDFLSLRDQLLRTLANESGRRSAFAVAASLRESRNNPTALEHCLCAAFDSLGFDVIPIGGKGKPDGVATALLSADASGFPRQYKVSLDAKSKAEDKGTVAAGTVKSGTIARHRDAYGCQHALVVGRAFPTKAGEKSALLQELTADRVKTAKAGEPKTITLVTIDTLADLVTLRPLKQLDLHALREMFTTCCSPEDSATWVGGIKKRRVTRPPYARIVKAIESLQKKRSLMQVKYSALLVELSHLTPPIEYDTEEALGELCRGMSQMAPGSIYAGRDVVSLDQSAINVIAAIEVAMKDFPEGP
jgi:hypothetical protein